MIIEYEEKYLEDVRDLFVELEEYILEIDEDHLDQLHPEYREKMAVIDLEEVYQNEGKCFLALEDDKVVGLIMGGVFPYEEYDYLDYKCPRRGEVTELIVTKEARKKGLGKKLMDKMEEYFKSIGCKYIRIEVFGYNKNAINFYQKEGYHTRMIHMIKKIDD